MAATGLAALLAAREGLCSAGEQVRAEGAEAERRQGGDVTAAPKAGVMTCS